MSLQREEQPGLEHAPQATNDLIPYHLENRWAYPDDRKGDARTVQKHTYFADGSGQGNQREQRRVLGLTVPAFWAVVIVLIIILAAGIGGGVGGGIAAQRLKQESDQSPTKSTTRSLSPEPTHTKPDSSQSQAPSSTSPALGRVSPAPTDGGCPTINGTNFTPLGADGQPLSMLGLSSQTFRQLCNTNYPSGAGGGNPAMTDLFKAYIPTLEQCITLCAEWNKAVVPGSRAFGEIGGKAYCRGVALIKSPGEFCYLKNSSAEGLVNRTFGKPELYVSAVLLPGSIAD